MSSTVMRRHGEFLVLEVPGLMEQRPSLLIGDKAVIKQPWSEANQVEQVGFIYEIRQKDLYLKFHSSFQETYDESDCDVFFETNLSTLMRAHDAVNRAMRLLGPKWLFPTAVQEKAPQVTFEVDENFNFSTEIKEEPKALTPKMSELLKSEEVNNKTSYVQKIFSPNSGKNGHVNPLQAAITIEHIEIVEYDIDDQGYLIPKKPNSKKRLPKNMKKRLTWFNESLNEQQRFAITNILKGQGRPLPYVIFGPPGTGKTVTIVETLLQIYRLIPASRLLIATPSNSAADLVCTRLIDSGLLEPGELVRVVSFNRASEGNIPEHLIPFCTTGKLF